MNSFIVIFFLFVPFAAADGFEGKNETFVQNRYGVKQFIRCFDQFNGYGNVVEAKYPISDLWDYNFDNRISSCCFTGFWLLYQDVNFNKYNPNVSKIFNRWCQLYSARTFNFFNHRLPCFLCQQLNTYKTILRLTDNDLLNK